MTIMDETAPLNQKPLPGDGGRISASIELPKQRKQSLAHKDVDSGWAWVVLITSYLTRIIMGGMFWAVNIYFVIFHEEFGENRSYTAAIGSAMFFTFHLAAPLSSIMIERYGVRFTTIVGGLLVTLNYILNAFANGVLFLIFTHCLFLGVGQCLVSNASLVGLSQYFRRYVNFTTGLSLSGTGIGMFIFARLIPYLIETFGWRGSMFVLAGIGLNFCAFGSTLFPLRTVPDKNNPIATKRQNTFSCTRMTELVSSPVVWCINLSFLCFALSSVTIMVLYKDIVILYGMNNVYEWCITIFGAGDIVGRAVSGLVTSHPKVTPVVFYGCVHMFTGLLILLLAVASHGPTAFMVLGFFLGAAVGAQIALASIVVLSMFGREKFVMILGYVQIFAGFGALSGPPITGFFTDSTGTYAFGLAFVAVIDAVASLSCFFSYCLKRRQAKADERSAQLQSEVQARMLETRLKLQTDSINVA